MVRGRTGKVIDPIHFDENWMDNIMSNQLKVGKSEELSNVILTAREKIVDAEDVFVSLQ
jgi:hypothetical protein